MHGPWRLGGGVDPLAGPQSGEQVADELWLDRTQHQVLAICGGIDVVKRVAPPRAFLLHLGCTALCKHRARGIGQPRQGAVVHGNVDVVAAATLLAPVQGHQNARQRHHRAGDVRHRHVRVGGLTILAQVQAQHAGQGLHAQIMGGQVAVGAGLAKGSNRGIHNARVHRRNAVVINAQALDHAGAKRLDDHVTGASQIQKARMVLRVFQIQHQAFFAPVGVAKPDAFATRSIANVTHRFALTRGLDLEHLGAMVGHHGGQVGPRQKKRQVQHPNAGELHAGAAPKRGEVKRCIWILSGQKQEGAKRLPPAPASDQRTRHHHHLLARSVHRVYPTTSVQLNHTPGFAPARCT